MTIDDIRKKLKQQQDYRANKVAEYRATLPQQQTSTWNAVQNRLLNENKTKLQQARLNQANNNVLIPKTQSTQPITNRTDMKEIKQTKKTDNVMYGVKKLGAGVLSGVTGIAESYLTDTASQLKKGEQKSTSQAVSDLTKKMLLPQPMNMLSNATETIKENIGTLTDSNKNVWQKVAGIAQNTVSDATNSLPFKGKTNAVIQTIGNFLKNKKSSDAVLNVNKVISKPSEAVNQALAQEGEQYGKATQFVGDALQSVGNMLPSVGVTAITGNPTAGMLTMGLGAKGSSTTEALNKGVELEDAVKRGDTDAMIEVGTEMLTGGVNIFGKGALDDLIQKGVVDRVKNNVAKFFVQQGVNIGGEILEETISDVLGTILDKGTVDPDASYSLDDWNKTAVTTMLSTLILNTLTGGLVGDIRQVQNDNLIDKSNLTDEQKENLRNFAEENNLNREQIERAIEITNTEQNQDTTIQNEPILNQEQQITQTEQKQTQNETSQEIRQDEELTEKTGQIVTNLMRSIDNYNNTRQEGEKVFDINDENTRKEIESIQKIAQNRGINITFDESRFDNSTDNAFYEYDDNGNVANIVLNPNSASKKYVQNLAVHELVHSFSGDKKTNLMNEVLNYAKTLEGYNKAYQDIQSKYQGVYGNNVSQDVINEEVVANILGEKLGDKQFVDDLINGTYSSQNKNFVQKIYDFVKNQINRFRGYKDQEQYWRNVKELFDEAYRKSEINQEGLKASVEANSIETRKDGTLLALHNLTADKLKGVLDLGGFPVPSIAITNQPHTQFGDISVVFDRNTIDPANIENEVYDRDVWSPTFPQVDYDISNENIKKYIINNIDYDRNDSIVSDAVLRYFYAENLTDLVDRYGIDNTLKQIKESPEMQYFYKTQVEKGDFKPVMKERQWSDAHPNETLQRFIDIFNKNHNMPLKDFFYHYINYGDMKLTDTERQQLNEEIKEALRPEVEEFYNKYSGRLTSEQVEKAINEELNDEIEVYGKFYDFIHQASLMSEEGVGEVIDRDSTLKEIPNQINKDNYNSWVDDTFGKLFKNTEKGIRNDKEAYTRSGNRRSFKQLHDDYTLDNIVRNLVAKRTTGGEGGFTAGGFGEIQAKQSQRFNSIEDIKNAENRITTSQEANEKLEPLRDMIGEDISILGEYYDSKGSYYDDSFRSSSMALSEFAEKKNLTEKGFRKVLESYYNFNVDKIPSETLNKIINDLNSLKNIDTDYFEAKPQRAVGLDEVKALVIPNNLDADLKQQLQDRGMRLIEYDPNIEGDREAKLRGAELQDLRFSKDTSGAWNNFIEKYFKNEGEGTSIQDLKKLPVKPITMADYEQILNDSKNIPLEDKKALKSDLKEINFSKKSLDEFTQYIKDLDRNYAEYNEEQLGKKLNKQEISQLYRTYQNKPTTYKKSSMKTALDTIQGNRYGRTKAEWLQVAELAGVENANLTPQELDKIANESWFDLAPNVKSQLNRQGQDYVEFNINDWRDAFYKGVKENRQYSIDTENTPQLPKSEQVELPKAKKILNPTEISNLTLEDVNTTPKLPTRNYEKGTKVSNFVSNIENDVGFLTENQKKELLKDENVTYYAPVTNADTLEKAYKNLTENGKNATMNWYAKNSENATAEDVATGWILLKQYADNGDTQGMVNVAKKLRDMGTKAGQTVQAFNILSRLTPEGMVAYTQGELQDAYNEMIKGKSKKWIDQHKSDFDLSQDEVAYIMDTMQNLPEENPANNNYDRKVALGQIQKLFTDKLPSEGNAIKSWMRISMLFNPKTQVRNVAGNAIVVPVNMFSDFLGSKVDKALSKYSGVRTLGTANKGYLKGMKQGFYQSYNDFKLGINTRDIEQNKFEFGQGKAFKDKGIGKALNRVDNLLNFVMDFGDRGFSQASFVNSLNNQMLLNGVTTPTQEMIDIATNEALSRTWNDDNDYTRFVLNIRKGLNKIGGKNYGLGDVLIPFAKTPANLTKAIVEYSPVGLTKSILDIPNIKNAIETGQFTAQQQHQFADHLGKGLAGTMLYILGYALASAGIATGESDEDKDVKNFLKNSLGIGAYSIKIGDKSFAYDWAQPIATSLAIMTNLYQTNKNNPDASLLDKTLSAVNIGTNQLLEQSFMESLNEVLNGNGEITERLQKAVLDLPARAIPTFSKQIADMVDSTQRTSFEYGKPLPSAINAVKAKLPGISKTLTPVVDTLGNEVQKYGGENNFFNVFFNPANMNKGEKTKAGEEIYNVYEQTGDTSIFPVTAPYYVNYNGEKITMDSAQRAGYQRTSGTYTEEAVNDLLNDKDYQKLDDEDKAEILSKVVTDSNEKAKRDVLGIENKNSDLQLIDEVGSDYYTYKLATKGMTKDAEQCSTLLNKNYSNENKKLIYESEINKEDKTFNGLQTISKTFNMDDYLKYKAQTFSGDKKKENTYNYVENSKFNRLEQLYILGRTYKLSVADRAEFERLLNQTALTPKQKREVYLTLNGVEEKDDGSIGWK